MSTSIHLYNEHRFEKGLREAWAAFETGEPLPDLERRADVLSIIVEGLPPTLARSHKRELLADYRSSLASRRGLLERQLYGDDRDEGSGVHSKGN